VIAITSITKFHLSDQLLTAKVSRLKEKLSGPFWLAPVVSVFFSFANSCARVCTIIVLQTQRRVRKKAKKNALRLSTSTRFELMLLTETDRSHARGFETLNHSSQSP
jgi:hypothetical protein